MYQISTSNGILGYTEIADYCYKLSSGSPQIIGKKEHERGIVATGIAYSGKIYNLPNHTDFEGAEIAYVTEVDAANILNQQAQRIAEQSAIESDLDAMIIDHELRVMDLELGLTEDI